MPAPRLVLLLAWIAVPIVFADDPPEPAGDPAMPVNPNSEAPQATGEPLRILVMTSGRVFEGAINETPGGYVVITPAGRVTLPFDQVACTATSLRDAHQKLKAFFNPPSASGHVVLCRWCIENQLYDLAKEEVEAALRLEPSRAEARQLSLQLQAFVSGQTREEPERLYSWDHLLTPPVPAPGGLTRETTDLFVRRVQPLMVNSCGNARCHGRPQATFHLDYVPLSGVGSQETTTANIESVFEFVDIDNPNESRLFTALLDPVIPQHRQVLVGPRGRDQLNSIAEWIMQGSLERGGRPQGMEPSDVQLAQAQASATDEVALAAGSAEPHVPMTLDSAPPISIEPSDSGAPLIPVAPPLLIRPSGSY